jgi:hypothetical protein
MKRTIGLGIGGLLALVVGLVLPQLPDSAFHALIGDTSFQGTAAFCPRFLPPWANAATIAQHASRIRLSCATASDVMNLGAWLVVLGALALAAAVVVLILGRIRRRPALSAHAV